MDHPWTIHGSSWIHAGNALAPLEPAWNLALSAQASRSFLGFSWLGMPEKDQELQCAGAVSICFHLFPSVSMML